MLSSSTTTPTKYDPITPSKHYLRSSPPKPLSSPPAGSTPSQILSRFEDIDISEHLNCVKCKQICRDPVLQECPHVLCLQCAKDIYQRSIDSAARVTGDSNIRKRLTTPESHGPPSLISGIDTIASFHSPILSGFKMTDSTISPLKPYSSHNDSKMSRLTGVSMDESPLVRAAKGLASIALLCPSCRTATPLGEEGPEGMRRNVLLRKVIERYRPSATADRASIARDKKYCQLCEKEPAVVYCAKCDVSYCDGCRETAHPSKGQFLKHPLVREGNMAPVLKRCREHLKYEQDFWCDRCKVAVCAVCLLSGEHAGHPKSHLSTASKVWRANITDSVQNVESLESKVHEAEATVDRTRDAVKEECAVLVERVKQERDVLVGILRRRADTIINEILAKRDTKLKRLDEQHHRLISQMDRCNSVHALGRNALRQDDEFEFVNGIAELHSKLLEESNQIIEASPCCEVDFGFKFEVSAQKLALEQMCLQHATAACAARTVAEGLGVIRGIVDVESSFNVIVKDIQGVVLDGLSATQPFVQVTDTRGYLLKVTITNKGNGKYECRYLPTLQGTYRIDVLMHDDHIGGSPFEIRVINPTN